MSLWKPPFGRRLSMLAALIVLAALFFTGSSSSGTSAPSEGRLLDRALGAISRNYVDPGRINPRAMLDGALDQMQRRVPEILVTDRAGSELTVTVGLAKRRVKAQPMRSLGDLARTLHEVLAFAVQHYTPDIDTPAEEIEYAAIDGSLEALDPHSNFMTPKVYNEFKVGTQGKFGGLGIVISIKDGMLTVIAPIEGTPAARAGIRSGDRIMQIDEESTINMSLTDAVNKLRGDVGTKVQLVMDRTGQPSRKVALERAVINIDSVQHRLLAAGDKQIGYIKLKSFQDNTDDDVRAALADFHQGGRQIDGLVLDMRNNPGGLLNVAVDVADEFLRKGIIVSTVGPRDQVLEQSVARAAGTEPDYPIVVLLNEGSASASEIVAGALEQNDRAVVMGRRSFGKGSVQTLFDLGDDAALKLTIAQYKPAGTQTIQLVGIQPDIELIPITVDAEEMNIVRDKLMSELDLEKHLDNSMAATPRPEPEQRSAFEVRFLQPREKDDEKAKEERSLKEYARLPEIAGDFAVELARDLIARSGSPSRKAMLAQVADPIREAQAAQQTVIDTALKAQGIDWASVPAKGTPRLTIAYHLKRGAEEIARARAGDKVRLELVATNAGNGPYAQLIAIGDSESALLAEREFPFGRLDPGQTRTFSSPIEIPEGMPSQDLQMELRFEEANRQTPEPVKVVLPVEEQPQPSFAFAARLSGVTAGRPLPVGTPIPFAVEIVNSGAGASGPETVATLSNECGEKLFIEQGRVKLGSMPAKSRKPAPFRFHLLPGEPPAACAVKLSIADFKHFVALTKAINLAPSTGVMKPPAGATYSPPRIELAAVPASTRDPAITIKGTITDTDPVRDAFVFAGERKIAYVPNPEETTSMPFTVNIPLEPGTNQIAIGARDREGLMGRKLIVVERTSGVRPKEKRASQSMGPTFMP